MAQPTRFPNGVNNLSPTEPGADLAVIDPTKYHVFFDDFDRYNASDWTITTTEAGAGSATEALTDEDGGVLLITNDDADNDADFFNKVGESFSITSGKKLRFKIRFKVSDATQSDFVAGLQITDTTPLAVTDGIYFRKDDGDANVDFVIIKDSSSTEESAISSVADDTYKTLEFVYNGSDKIAVFADGALAHSATTLTNLPDDEVLTVSFGIVNGEAAAKTLSIDYILVAKER